MSNNIIYGLLDPETQELRYIGYTNNINRRMLAHYNPSNLKKITYKNNWIKSLLQRNKKPQVIILEMYENANELPLAEIDCIAYYKYIGANLVNGTFGGDGAIGRVVSQETKLKISKANTGRKQTKEQREKWKKANKGKPSPNKGKKASDELRLKLSLAHIGKQGKKKILSEEQEINMINDFNSGICTTKKALSKKYNVSRDVVFKIFRRAREKS